ncbi:EpsD family peptidyl-prolyl cis-trans isomerase [Nitrosomonas sp.]|uniref:EpsD family peptidyl-prolyl cis-trans isomerase n=1 Tax=Nitrosomonas sp. TaxID=42353 RepID=UPI0027321186|nr:EpsD family peptidyl-prolyl cis-trans isomerase [Nitrosomonas sp.]MDP2225054.1 EpsD family peptidyl-prolyl cis-trans isomerase [Nitrosomonas sp.]
MVLAYTRMALIGFVSISVLVLTACDSEPKEKKSGQALVSVNGKEVTMLQLNDEIKRANIRPDQYEAASKQLLESLIARQLIMDEAISNKLDRTPDVMQARERANAQIISQAYMQSIVSKVAKPSKAEIDDYYQKHPEYFSQRKQFDLTIVRIATKDLGDELKKIIESAKSLDEVVAWLDKNKVQYLRNLASRSTTDLPPQMATMMQQKSKDTIFIINEQENSLLISVNAIKDSPITAAVAAPQIEKFLMNQKYKEATDAEVARLRAAAKIEYLNAKTSTSDAEKPAVQSAVTPPSDVTNNLNITESVSEGAIERGIMGIK